MHPEARPRIDLDDAASGFEHRPAYIWGDQVDACNVQPDDLRSPASNCRIVRMNNVGTVYRRTARGEVCRGKKGHRMAHGRRARKSKARTTDVVDEARVDRDLGQNRAMAFTAARILIGAFYQLLNRRFPIAYDMRGHAPCGRHHFASDDQEPVVIAFELLLD